MHVLRKLNSNKSPEIDLLSLRIMKECATVFADSLCLLLNRWFSFGPAALAWEIVNKVPIHEKGIKKSPK